MIEYLHRGSSSQKEGLRWADLIAYSADFYDCFFGPKNRDWFEEIFKFNMSSGFVTAKAPLCIIPSAWEAPSICYRVESRQFKRHLFVLPDRGLGICRSTNSSSFIPFMNSPYKASSLRAVTFSSVLSILNGNTVCRIMSSPLSSWECFASPVKIILHWNLLTQKGFFIFHPSNV